MKFFFPFYLLMSFELIYGAVTCVRFVVGEAQSQIYKLIILIKQHKFTIQFE